jgi:hypothetical protein
MQRGFYLVTRDLHLYAGLFISPFVVLFAWSVFLLVHPSSPSSAPAARAAGPVGSLEIPPGLENLSGRARVDAARPLLDRAGVHGEIGFIRYIPKEHRLSIPVSVPGRETTFEIDLDSRSATVTSRETGVWDALVQLHKSPGPHLAEIRMNWIAMRIWRWLADATVYLLLFITASGIYLWTVLRSERRVGIVMLMAGAASFFGMVYALVAG